MQSRISTIALTIVITGLIGSLFAISFAQTPMNPPSTAPQTATDENLDAVTRQAAQLEAQLAKLSSTTAEAAELMLKLIDLYHSEGRPFGLVRVAQTFVAQHSSHPRHKEAMLKLIDGLRVTGRNKELIAATRQFLARHPNDPAGADIERWLPRLLLRDRDPSGAAALYEAHWKRLGGTPEGRRAGLQAITIDFQLNNKESLTHAAAIAEDMLEKLPAGGPATAAGWAALDAHERLNDWAKANRVAAKLLQKSPPTNPTTFQLLHARMAENFIRQGQRANAVDSFRKALAVPNAPAQPDWMSRMIYELHHTTPKPAEIEAAVNEYRQKFPQRTDIPELRVLVAYAYFHAKDLVKAEQLFAELLPAAARAHNCIGMYLQLAANEPDEKARAGRLAQAEQTLRGAIAQATHPHNAAALRYHLIFDIYRDRLKDLGKARATAYEYLDQSPSNDGYTDGIVNWLLETASDQAAFAADLDKILASRKKFPWLNTFRTNLTNWAKARQKDKNKEIAQRAELVLAKLNDSDKEPAIADWHAYHLAWQSNNGATIAKAREKLLEPARLAALPDELANQLLYDQQHYLRYYAPNAQREQSVQVSQLWAQRMPKSFEAASTYLAWALDFGKTDHYRPATELVLNRPATSYYHDAARRMMQVAAHFKDPALGKRVWDWIKEQYTRFGYDSTYAAYYGDVLTQFDLKNEARDAWSRSFQGSPESYEIRECGWRILNSLPEAERGKFLDERLAQDTAFRFSFAVFRADLLLKTGDVAAAERLLREAAERQRDRAFGWQNIEADHGTVMNWVGHYRNVTDMPPAQKAALFALIRDLDLPRASMLGIAALAELPDSEIAKLPPMRRLLALSAATQTSVGDAYDYDLLMPYAQAAMARKDYLAAATLLSGMLANCPGIDDGRKKAGRDLLTQAYTRLGASGAAVIDENSPIAPLLQAALQLRLGDSKLAFETYLAHQQLFDQHRAEVPIDLLDFVCNSHMAAGGDDNHNRVEDIVRTWLIKNSEAKEIDDVDKARVQLLLARNYFRSKRYDLARAEFTTLLNKYPKTPQAVEAEFGIGETFMEQKVYDQAEQTFERLANRRDRDIVIRAEFLRGVLANRRGDRDEARQIFRSVLERVPNIDLANQALFNLSEVYGAEQRYVDQLELLRTIGRLGRASKRFHTPGEPLSIVVQDSDLGVSRGHSRIPVLVTTEPGGDSELIYLLSGGAGKGLFRADLETRLGAANKNDRILQLSGQDVIRVDYPPEFKKEFKDTPLPDSEIRIASDARLEMASSKIVDVNEETFSQQLERESRTNPDEEEQRKGLIRPKDQVKPGNLVYLRVKDADRDLTDQPDTITLRLTTSSGDQVQVTLTETGPHTGVFEGTAKTGELPAGATASNTAIDHSPLMAIDKDPQTTWLSEPDGATPKHLAIDLKDLKHTDTLTLWTPNPDQHAPVRMILQGSDDGRLWFRLAATQPDSTTPPVSGEFGPMTARIYENPNAFRFTAWDQVVALSKNSTPTTTAKASDLFWTREPDEDPKSAKPIAIIWSGKLVQAKTGPARIQVAGTVTAVMIDGRLELPVGPGNRQVDVYLDAGTHDLTIFTAAAPTTKTLEAKWLSGDIASQTQLILVPFRENDFDLSRPEAKTAATPRALGQAQRSEDGKSWQFKFPPIDVRHLRLVIEEYRGEAVAINHIEIRDSVKNQLHIPTDADLLSLSKNDVLELAGGDTIVATYIDDVNLSEGSRLLTAKLTATYHNAQVTPINYDFIRQANGQVATIRKEVLRIEPGERFIMEVVDFDQDLSADLDRIKVQVAVNNGEAIELEATETDQNSGIFTKEIDTSATPSEGKLTVKAGDRIFLRYLDQQNTLPGHATVREAVVYVNEPTPGRLRVLETRVSRPKPPANNPTVNLPPILQYLPSRDDDADTTAGVAFEAPFTIEVIDRDAAKDSRSKVLVNLKTSNGASVDVECVLDDRRLYSNFRDRPGTALQEGRFTGQVILQLGNKDSPALVPLTSTMPRNLIGGPKLQDDDDTPGDANTTADRGLVTKVLNLTGADIITATYIDKRRPENTSETLTAKARLLSDGKVSVTDAEYQMEITSVHVGERLFLKVVDADLDRTPERDTAKVRIRSPRGEDETILLEETLAHSGVFTGSVRLHPAEKPTPGNLRPEAPEIECYFGDQLEVTYIDERASSTSGSVESTVTVLVVIGTDGKLQAFSKAFSNEQLAVETQFHIAESHFELFKSHQSLGREQEAKADLESGRRVLQELMEDYPNPKYAPRVAYLLGQFAQELKQFGEAIQLYQTIVKQYPDHSLAPDAQFKLAQCYEEANEFDQALEAYVTLAATYPQHPLIANVMVRISEHFYKAENYKVAAQVGEKFLEKFEGHKWSPKMAFRVGQCYYKDKQYTKAAAAFDRFAKLFPDDVLGPDALFWAGESFRMANNARDAFRRYNKCRWDYPASEAAKYARGRLALPEMLSQFEAEASGVEMNNN